MVVNQELDCERWKETLRFRRQILSLRQSNDRRLRALFVNAGEPGCATRVFLRLPLDLGDETLRMGRLLAHLAKLVRRVTEGPIGLLSEEVVEFLPHVLLDWNRVV